MDVEQVIKLGVKLYDKYSKVNIDKIYNKILEE